MTLFSNIATLGDEDHKMHIAYPQMDRWRKLCIWRVPGTLLRQPESLTKLQGAPTVAYACFGPLDPQLRVPTTTGALTSRCEYYNSVVNVKYSLQQRVTSLQQKACGPITFFCTLANGIVRFCLLFQHSCGILMALQMQGLEDLPLHGLLAKSLVFHLHLSR